MRSLVIDGQLFQTPALQRGMGKYSLELIQALSSASSDWDSIEIIISSNIDTAPEFYEYVVKKIPRVTIKELDLKPYEIGNHDKVAFNRSVIEDYVQGINGEVDFLILSLMQGEIHPVFPRLPYIRKMVLFYDLIPLMFHKVYLGNPITREEYLFKIKELLAADLYLAISETVANDLSFYLGVDQSRVVSIDGGPIVHGDLEKVFAVHKPFVLMPTGNDLRKNNYRGIKAFEDFNKNHGERYCLVVTSFFKDHEVKSLKALSRSVIFTGNISGEEMQYLYKNCSALLFPSEYEGLGLPILEAVEFGKPVACSNISVFREMSMVDFDFFSPKDINSISAALDQAIFHRRINKKNYSRILSKYTWSNTAKLAISALADVERVNEAQKAQIVVVTPDLSRPDALARSHLMEFAELSRWFKLDYCILPVAAGSEEMRINFLPYITETFALSELRKTGLKLFMIDNLVSYDKTMMAALSESGILLLYDTDLRDLWHGAKKNKLISKSRLKAEEAVESALKIKKSKYIISLVANQQAVVVFSESDFAAVREVTKGLNKNVPVFKLDLPVVSAKYPAILPDKKEESVSDASAMPGEGKTGIDQITDFNFLEQLSMSSKIDCSVKAESKGGKNVLLLEALARNTLPSIRPEDSYFNLRKEPFARALKGHKITELLIPLSYKCYAFKLRKIIHEINRSHEA